MGKIWVMQRWPYLPMEPVAGKMPALPLLDKAGMAAWGATVLTISIVAIGCFSVAPSPHHEIAELL